MLGIAFSNKTVNHSVVNIRPGTWRIYPNIFPLRKPRLEHFANNYIYIDMLRQREISEQTRKRFLAIDYVILS